jgi:hypothetical protein
MILLSTSGIQRAVSNRAQRSTLGTAREELSIRMVAGFAELAERKAERPET